MIIMVVASLPGRQKRGGNKKPFPLLLLLLPPIGYPPPHLSSLPVSLAVQVITDGGRRQQLEGRDRGSANQRPPAESDNFLGRMREKSRAERGRKCDGELNAPF